jgi:hypothetical protein
MGWCRLQERRGRRGRRASGCGAAQHGWPERRQRLDARLELDERGGGTGGLLR